MTLATNTTPSCNWHTFNALVAVGFNSKVAVVDLSCSSDSVASDLVMDDILEPTWAQSASIDLEVPGIYQVIGEVDLYADGEPEYRNVTQTPVSYTLPSEQ